MLLTLTCCVALMVNAETRSERPFHIEKVQAETTPQRSLKLPSRDPAVVCWVIPALRNREVCSDPLPYSTAERIAKDTRDEYPYPSIYKEGSSEFVLKTDPKGPIVAASRATQAIVCRTFPPTNADYCDGPAIFSFPEAERRYALEIERGVSSPRLYVEGTAGYNLRVYGHKHQTKTH